VIAIRASSSTFLTSQTTSYAYHVVTARTRADCLPIYTGAKTLPIYTHSLAFPFQTLRLFSPRCRSYIKTCRPPPPTLVLITDTHWRGLSAAERATAAAAVVVVASNPCTLPPPGKAARSPMSCYTQLTNCEELTVYSGHKCISVNSTIHLVYLHPIMLPAFSRSLDLVQVGGLPNCTPIGLQYTSPSTASAPITTCYLNTEQFHNKT